MMSDVNPRKDLFFSPKETKNDTNLHRAMKVLSTFLRCHLVADMAGFEIQERMQRAIFLI